MSRAPVGGTDRHLFGMDIMRNYCIDYAFDNNEINIIIERDTKC